jgi:hypothetical protein
MTSMGLRLEHPMVARISLAGYATKEIQMTDGPMSWISVNGRNHGEYWLLKSDHFQVNLAAGSHVMVIRSAGLAEWKRTLEILKDSQVTLEPVFKRAP